MKIWNTHVALIDSTRSLMNEFKDDTSNTLLIVGGNVLAHFNYDFDSITKGYDKVIMFNQENYANASALGWFDKYIALAKRCDEVWDYDERNIPHFAQHGIEAKLHILQPYMNWDIYAPVDKDIDILVYGSHFERRDNVVEFLRHKYRVEFLDNTYGDALDSYIMRSKILLNVHSTDHAAQEQARMIKWLGAPCQIISERSPYNYLGVPEMDYWELFCL